jgi:hypothetical protein
MASDLPYFLALPFGIRTANHAVKMYRGKPKENQKWGEVFRGLIGERNTPQK